MFNNRKEAKLNNDKFYNTSKPCKNGHNSDRYTNNGSCVKCAYENLKKYTAENREHILERDKNWRKNNPDKEKARHKRWQENNRAKCCLRTANRKAKKLQANPQGQGREFPALSLIH